MVGERDFARPHAMSAADQRLQGRRMVRVAEIAATAELALGEIARQRTHHGSFQRFIGLERRQQARQARRQHRLARTGRADHQQIVAAGRRHFEHALGAFLALDLRKVGINGAVVGDQRFRHRQRLLATQMVEQGKQRGRRHDGRAFAVAGRGLEAAPSRLAAAHRGADQATAGRGRGDRRRQYARHTAEGAIQRQFAQHHEIFQALAGEHTHGGKKCEGNRQVVVAAFLSQIGRRQIDGDALWREGQAQRPECCPHPLATFAHGLVGEADHRESDGPRRDHDLHVDRQDVDALESHGPHLCLHIALLILENNYRTSKI